MPCRYIYQREIVSAMSTEDKWNVTIEASNDMEAIDEEEKYWTLKFEFRYGPLNCLFFVEEPYLIRLDQWEALIATNKKTFLQLYEGNGDGSIYKTNGMYTFIGALSGNSGPVSSSFKVPASVVDGPFQAAIDHAREQDYRFKQ